MRASPTFSSETNWDRFNPGPTFQQALQCRKPVIALEGAVGTGKSSIFCLFIGWHCAENPGAIWIVIRRTYKMLTDNTISGTWLKWFPDGQAGYLDSELNYHLDCELFGKRAIGEIRFRPAERQEDIDRFMGGEYAGAALDEVTGTYREMGLPEDVYTGLQMRLRQPGMKRYHEILAFNPPPPGNWVAAEFPLPARQTEDIGHFVIPPKENEANLPKGYYDKLFRLWKLKEDWAARFLRGERVPIGKANSVFDRAALLAALEDWKREPVACGILKRHPDTKQVMLDRVADAPLRIWEMPKSKTRDRYVIGVDSGSGLADRDPSCAEVISRVNGNVVAEWHGHLSPRAFAKEVAMLAWFYNEAFVVPEVEPSADGRSLCDALEHLGYGYVYQQRREQNIGDPVVRRLGLPMSKFNKCRIVGRGREVLSDKHGKIPNEELLLELLGFVEREDGRMAGDEGVPDDRVMAWLCALEGYDREGSFMPSRLDGDERAEMVELVESIQMAGAGADNAWMAG